MLTIAAPLHQEGYKIKIIDQRTDNNWRNTLKEELKKNPICTAISAISGTQIGFGIAANKIVKEYNKEQRIIWGGTHATILPEQTLENEDIDIVVKGEGEKTFYELIKGLEKIHNYRISKGYF